MQDKIYFIIDFDSAFVTVEGLKDLARIALKDYKNTKTRKYNKLISGQVRKYKNKIIKEIEEITRQGMEGKIGFGESLEKRLKLLRANKKHLIKLISVLNKKITRSVSRNSEFFEKISDRIYIVSGGFKDFIWPVVKQFEIKESATSWRTSLGGDIVGYKALTGLLGKKTLSHPCRGEKVKIWIN